MKKVLMIAHSFPPLQVVGSQRPYKLAKYFPKFGWEPIVLTIKHAGKSPEGIRIIETDYKKDIVSVIKAKIGFNPAETAREQLGIKVSKNFNHITWKSKIIKLVKEVTNFPDDRRGWYKFALKSASEFLLKEKIDAIISTSSPVTSHLIARKLKQKYKILWVADLRDLWSQNPYVNKFSLIKYFEKRLELKTLSDADAIVTVTSPWIDTLKTLHKNKKVFCVTNGYDEDDFASLSSKLTRKFTITYTGTLYNGKRDPSLLFKVVTQLINENRINKDLIEIRLFVNKQDWLIDDIKKYNLEKVVNTYCFIPREKVLERQRESQVLLLLLWDNKGEAGFCPGKVYEYLGAKRPIIATGGREHVVKDILKATNAGKYAWSPDTLRNVLLDYYEEFIKLGEVKCHSNSNIENYTYNSIVKRYSDILNGMVLE